MPQSTTPDRWPPPVAGARTVRSVTTLSLSGPIAATCSPHSGGDGGPGDLASVMLGGLDGVVQLVIIGARHDLRHTLRGVVVALDEQLGGDR